MKKDNDENKTFEELLSSIDEILRKLEQEDLDLEDSLKLYEQGMGSYHDAYQKLGAVRKRLAQLVAVDAEGNEQTVELDVSDAE